MSISNYILLFLKNITRKDIKGIDQKMDKHLPLYAVPVRSDLKTINKQQVDTFEILQEVKKRK